jgi:predicted transcriptional regulator
MTKIVAGSVVTCDPDVIAMELAEADFILAVQSEIQRVMNDKGLRARDLSKRLGVSEARISQMFGEQAKNLTLRTIARLFFKMSETPIVSTKFQLERLLATARGGEDNIEQQWTIVGLANDIQVGSGITVARDDKNVASVDQRRMVNQWARAEEADTRRPRRLAAVG